MRYYHQKMCLRTSSVLSRSVLSIFNEIEFTFKWLDSLLTTLFRGWGQTPQNLLKCSSVYIPTTCAKAHLKIFKRSKAKRGGKHFLMFGIIFRLNVAITELWSFDYAQYCTQQMRFTSYLVNYRTSEHMFWNLSFTNSTKLLFQASNVCRAIKICTQLSFKRAHYFMTIPYILFCIGIYRLY